MRSSFCANLAQSDAYDCRPGTEVRQARDREAIAAARLQRATDLEIHDTLLIAAAFRMYNRYVDGLATVQPQAESMYTAMGRRLADHGYRTPSVRTAEKA